MEEVERVQERVVSKRRTRAQSVLSKNVALKGRREKQHNVEGDVGSGGRIFFNGHILVFLYARRND